jgi:hypothetical protein
MDTNPFDRANSQPAVALTSAINRTLSYFKRHSASATVREIFFGLLRERAKVRSHAASRRFDEENHLRTEGQVFLSDLSTAGAPTDQSMWYEPAPINVVPDVLSKLRKSYQGFTFVDLGSGRGRVVLQASHFNFHKAVGVEFAEELHRQAVENSRQYPKLRQKCEDIEFLQLDVRKFEFPMGDTVIFVFDSFKADLLRAVIAKLKQSYLASPRKIYLIYLNPLDRNSPIPIIEGSGFLHRKNIFSFVEQALYYRNCSLRVVVYEAQ